MDLELHETTFPCPNISVASQVFVVDNIIVVPQLLRTNLSTMPTSSNVPWKHLTLPIQSAFTWGSKGLEYVYTALMFQ